MINARVVRGVVLSLREQEFVEAATGARRSPTPGSSSGICCPTSPASIIVQATLDVAAAILAEAALSFVGLGVQAPDTSLGLLTAGARQSVATRPWLFYFPGLTIILIALTHQLHR